MTTATRVAKQNKWGDNSRFYDTPNGRYPSVTTVLGCIGKPALIAWSARVEREMVMACSAELYDEICNYPISHGDVSKLGWITTLSARIGKEKAHSKALKKAGDIGSQAHAWIEHSIKAQLMHKVGPCPIISPAAHLAVAGFERWRDSLVSFKPILCEQAVWSDTYKVAGTMDLFAEIDDGSGPRLTVPDWKTGKAVYPEAKLQNTFYRHMVREMGLASGPISGLILRLPKTENDPEFEAHWIEEPEEELMPVCLSVLELWKFLHKDEKLEEVKNAQ
jgi:hypothetical protein